MRKIFLAACCLVMSNAFASPFIKSMGGTPFDFNAPIVQSKSSLTNLSPAGQIVFENSSLGFWGLAPDGTWVPFGSTTGIRSQIKVNGSSGNGSTGNRVKIFTDLEYSNGSDITYTKHLTGVDGDKFTINTDGLYSISYSASADDGDYFAISVDASQTTASTSLAADKVLARCFQSGGSTITNCSWTGELNAGQVIRAHQDGTTPGNDALNTFTITKINN